jgi:muramoyltetrapeptide carboxypeptidase
MDRRHFAKLAATLAALPALTVAAETREAPRTLVKPRRLKQGDLVGVVAPSGVADDAILERDVRNLESLGLRVKMGANVRAVHGGYAGTVQQRLEDLHGMLRDREVAALWAARGGSGCAALLPHIDYALARRSRKVVVGYSDLTALHLALLRHAGLVTFHGPVASTITEYSAARLREVLMEPTPTLTFTLAPENLAKAAENPEYAPRTYRAGRAEGRLVGGNLSVLSSLIGTPYAAVTKGRLLFLEEVGEAPYRVDRMLTQLAQAGELNGTAAVVLGVFRKCTPPDDEPSLTLQQVLESHLTALRVPAAYGYSFGHIPQQYTLPLGVRARLDTEARTLTLLEPAVVS